MENEITEKMDGDLIKLVEKGILELSAYKDGVLYFKSINKKKTDKKRRSIETTIKRLEEEYSRLENNGFPLPLEELDKIYPELTEKSKQILVRFSGWLGEHKIILEICSEYEFSFLFGLFKYLNIQGNRITVKQRKRLDDIIKRCLDVRATLLNKHNHR